MRRNCLFRRIFFACQAMKRFLRGKGYRSPNIWATFADKRSHSMKKYILAIDQGTTSSRALVFDRRGNVIAAAWEEFPQYYPQAGWVEQNPEELLQSVVNVVQKVMQEINPADVASVGITNQRETTIIWDKHSGKAVYNAIVWQSRQSNAICEQLRQDGLSDTVRQNTGLVIDPYFSATKIKWLLDYAPNLRRDAEAGRLLFGTVDSWILWNLSREKTHATDYSNAARTMLFNIHSLQWDESLCSALQIPLSMLPKVCNSSHTFGHLRHELFGLPAHADPIPICGIAGDQQAALFGQNCFQAGKAKNTYGTGCFMLMNTGPKAVQSQNGLLTTIAWGLDGKVDYALEGSIFVAGAAVKWLRDSLELIREAADTEGYAKSIPDNDGVYFVPAFVGLGAPYWDSDVRGAIFGLTRGSGKAHIIRAALESIAYQTKDVLNIMEKDSGIPVQMLRVDGGMVGNNFLMQFQSDLLRVPVERPLVQESTALGAAYFAGLACGFWQDLADIAGNWQLDKIWEPALPDAKAQRWYAGWKKAVKTAQKFKD